MCHGNSGEHEVWYVTQASVEFTWTVPKNNGELAVKKSMSKQLLRRLKTISVVKTFGEDYCN